MQDYPPFSPQLYFSCCNKTSLSLASVHRSEERRPERTRERDKYGQFWWWRENCSFQVKTPLCSQSARTLSCLYTPHSPGQSRAYFNWKVIKYDENKTWKYIHLANCQTGKMQEGNLTPFVVKFITSTSSTDISSERLETFWIPF